MTVFFGIIDLKRTEITSTIKKSMKTIMEDDIDGECSFEFSKDFFYCINYDSGAYKASGLQVSENGITIIVGDPIINQENNRSIDVLNLHAQFDQGIPKLLCKARGIFAGIHFDSQKTDCYFFTDKLGLRPVYYYLHNELLIFSSTLSYLEKLTFVNLEEDFIGICESSAFTYPLADRTAFKHIKILLAGEIFHVKNGHVKSSTYWNWYTEPLTEKHNNIDTICQKAFDTFDEAVRLRLGDERNVFAFLSGGLDSRCVTAALKKHVININTFNFSKEQSQDSEFAKEYSIELGSHHHEIRMSKYSYPNWSDLIAKAINDVNIDTERPKYPQKIWTGDGGSMGTGFVYLDITMIEYLETGNFDKAIERFLIINKTGFPYRFVSNYSFNNAKTLIHENVYNEISHMVGIPLEKTLYMFLLLNDQRRHLSVHFETIAKHKIELMAPFFDSNFLSILLSIPIKEGLDHKFYMKWFKLFPEFARITPWQTYPGHQKCPLAITSELSNQWESSKIIHDTLKTKADTNHVIRIILNNASVRRHIRLFSTMIALLFHRYKINDYSYLIDFIKLVSNKIKNS